ncbi:sensor histidine kinase [Microbacterium sp. Sa4CUA7]|uniref:histidine kinase n=1 Tax=Microbacterium pullorum TaxID=2762236 RepID=A0ABR8S430_9MICO|nr:histidine kinase [Microbacterium pullorum]MBD7958242.1 sensor histidine kinase [Microbacterium pullorum]
MFRELKSYQIVVDVGGAGLFGLLAFYLELEMGRQLPYNALSTALVVVAMSAALAVRRLSPGLALGVAWVGAIVQMAFGRDPSPTDVVVFAVLYTAAAYGTRRVFWAGFASVIIGAIAITTYLFAPAVDPLGRSALTTSVAVLIAALFGLGLAWTTGALVRTGIRARENRLAQQAAEADTAAEHERVRIARDMHDVVAHSLAVVIAQADGARYAAAVDPQAAATALTTISTTARSALSDVRLLLTQLRHSQGEGPQPTIADLEELYAQVRSAGVDLRVDVDPMPPGVPPAAIQLAVYRILQEALTNALRHGAGGAVTVELAWHPDRVTILVHNPFADAPAPDDLARGHGLIGMRERALLAGGTLDAGREGGAFVVRASLPIGGAA